MKNKRLGVKLRAENERKINIIQNPIEMEMNYLYFVLILLTQQSVQQRKS